MKKINPIPGSKPFQKDKDPRRNLKGRPKGSPNSATVIRKWLETKGKLVNPVTGELAVMSRYDQVVLAQIARAIKEDTAAFSALMDRMEGKPMQRIEAEIENQNINVEVSAKRRNEILKAFKDGF
jgi:hypothetical protein